MRDQLSMLERLDLETKVFHGPADSGRVALLGNPTRARYADYLAKLYAFEAPAEWRWLRTPGLDRVIELSPSLFAPLLANDLGTLGRFPDVCPTTAFRGVAHGLGWLYVIERGRLMNSMLHRHLVRRLPFESSIAGSYLAGSGSLGLRWQQLGTALDEVARNPAMIGQIINGALEAFRMMRHTPPTTQPARKAA
jgi:heme oxygenase